MSIIKIKRSGVSGSPSSLGQGELAYSYLSGTQSNGGDRLYIGTGVETGGNAANIEVIGGSYFTAKLDHVPGTLVSNSAIIVDADSKIDILNVDNLTFNGSTISNSTDDIVILANGNIEVSGSKITGLGTPTANTDAATKKYVDDQFGGSAIVFYIDADVGSQDAVFGSEVLTFVGDTGITTSVSNNTITIDLDDTSVSPGVYGNTTAIPVFTVDGQGRLTSANTVSVATDLSIAGDTGTDTVSLLTDVLTFAGGDSITTVISGNTVTINADDATTTTKGVASFDTNNFTVTSGAVSSKDIVIGNTAVTLGETTTTLEGLTAVIIDNINIDGNTISSLDTNGDITISPNGSGRISVDNSRIIDLADPVNPQDAATKAYVDEVATGLQVKGSAEAATNNDIGATYDNGNNGIGSTLTIPATDTLDIDGWTSWSQFDGILVKDQTNPEENGRYFISTVGNSSVDWVLTRCGACDTPDEIIGAFVFVSHGNLYEGTGWVATVANVDSFAVGVDPITWTQFSGVGTFTAGAGLSLIGNDFNVNVDDSSIEIVTDTLQVKALGITNAMLAGSIQNSKLINSTITFAGDSGNTSVDLGDTFTITGNSGITATVSADAIDIAGDIATDTTVGVAKFSNTDFTVDGSGLVELNDESIQDIIGNILVEGEGIDISYDDNGNQIIVSAELATTSNKGVASFDSDNFAVANGVVTIAEVDGGTY